MDYNFFESSTSAKKKKSGGAPVWIFILVAVLVVGALGGLTVLNMINTANAKKEKAIIEERIAQNKIKIAALSKKKAQESNLKEAVTFFSALDTAVKESRTVNTTVMDLLNTATKNTDKIYVTLTDLEIKNRAVTLRGAASVQPKVDEVGNPTKFEENSNVATYQEKVRGLEKFTNIQVTKIELPNAINNYVFDMKLNINFIIDTLIPTSSSDTSVQPAVNNTEKGVTAQ